ncbi:uncharacterized protein RCC_07112 [Ramularia collo-cygni]|uniref:Uncharacterized protein n=1 Tax=Ramularia collo-cygni TaxID=112498 RepID=A0A2D3VH48_9PEZI|nr:uncharacterized protein RCC_07112 [Ramularia collo-cygni]CZT21249.1 uncharacterized protein RCC_07112 [Ramularia collo-cygni]
MNTVRSVGYGWGVLIVAGGGSYYFAKRSINADREERAHAEEMRRQNAEKQRVAEAMARSSNMAKKAKRKSDHPSPSDEAGGDPAAVEHEIPQSKFAASEPYRSKRGDRFS